MGGIPWLTTAYVVGKGGRSKACANCYRCRIKCDLTSPGCQRCEKAYLKCGGYPETTFIQIEGRGTEKQASQLGDASDENVDLVSRRPFNPLQQASEVFSTHIISIPHDDIFVNYTRARLLNGPDAEDIWTTDMSRDLRDGAFVTLATTFFGAEHSDGALIQRGLKRYSYMLEKINGALADRSQCQSFDLLEGVVIMALFEVGNFSAYFFGAETNPRFTAVSCFGKN